ncbi:hypothetical protein ANN_17746 [Periplaneta americana]|uniref:Transposable element Tc1 transposase n=1 Tax=Periplaneta americana TaxID=6978 RepID=A0ABQ8SV25_PERAM|nr:hypothetical protein ANN_17746 [Periplaneta americana]
MPGRRRRPPFMLLSQFERGQIIGMMEMGASYREISRRTSRSLRTIQRVCTQWTQEGTSTRRPGSGQPRATSESEDRRIVRTAVADRWASAPQIRAAVNCRVSPRTVVNRLLAAGYHSRAPMQCVTLTPMQRRQRHLWCIERRQWRAEWNAAVFSDESRFCLQHNDGRQHVRRRRGERAHAPTIVERHTGPTAGIMVWGRSVTTVTRPIGNRTRVDAMGRRIHAHVLPAATVAQLTEQVLQAWREIPQQDIRNLFAPMPTVHRCSWWPHRVLSHPLPTTAER